jgi:hypothetical protein
MDIIVIGYGSLMSGQGLAFSGVFQAKDARIVALTGCARGFAKPSRYGNHLAMVLELSQLPLMGCEVSPGSVPNGKIEALALTLSLDDVCRLAQREGYQPKMMRRLAELARARRLSLADFLWDLHAEEGHDLVAYRRRLFTLTGFTSAHYIPHPVCLDDAKRAITFLAPGFEGTGSDMVVAVRRQSNVRAVMSTQDAWQDKPNGNQLAYFLCCVLGGAHGICVRDLLPPASAAPALITALADGLAAGLSEEYGRFLTATGLSRAQYERCFGGPEAALARSGLTEFLNNASALFHGGRGLE